MKLKINLVLGVAALFLIAACSDSTSVSPVSITGGSGSPVVVDGTWDTACGASNTYPSEKSVDSFAGTGHSRTETIYTFLGNCTSDFYTQTISGTYAVVGEDPAATLNGVAVTATRIAFTLTSLTVLPSNNLVATQLNNDALYGLSNWSPGVSQNVTDIAAGLAGSNIFNGLIYIDDTAIPDTMFGDNSPVPIIAGFPTVLDNSVRAFRR